VPLYLTEADVAELAEPADAVPVVEACFRRLAAGAIAQMPRYRLHTDGGEYAVMAAVDHELQVAGLKNYTWIDGTLSFLACLFSTVDGAPLAVMEANRLGWLRTGAASAVAAKHLARSGATSIGLIGAGWHARSQLAAIRAAVPTLEDAVAWSRTPEPLAAFCRETGARPGGGPEEPAGCDIVVTVTSSKDPVVRGDWLRPGALVCGVGANDPAKRELDARVIARSSFVCTDSLAEARREAGDLIEPVDVGQLDWLEVHALQDVVSGEVTGRHGDDDIVVFKSNGMAALDVAMAEELVRRARQRGVGRELGPEPSGA
jgi:ornithine cyclodeaminase/alanine dehydrogenase-like protein (mu-crystallin family)